MRQNSEVAKIWVKFRSYDSHAAPFFAVLKHRGGASCREERTGDIQTISHAITACFSVICYLITTSCKLEGPFLTLRGEPQGFGFPARRATNDKPAPHFQGAEAMADMAFIPLESTDQLLVATRDPALRPLVIGDQPAQDTLLELGEAGHSHPHSLQPSPPRVSLSAACRRLTAWRAPIPSRLCSIAPPCGWCGFSGEHAPGRPRSAPCASQCALPHTWGTRLGRSPIA
jgi:hypothetical protein